MRKRSWRRIRAFEPASVRVPHTLALQSHAAGMALLVYDKECGSFSAPAFTSSVVDRVGSGDAVLALTSPLSALGVHPEVIGLIG